MSDIPKSDSEPSLGLWKAKICTHLGAALIFTLFALHESASNLFGRFCLPLLFCYVAAFEYLQLRRLKSGKGLYRTPPMPFRYVGLAFCVAVTYLLLSSLPNQVSPQDRGIVRALMYVGLVAFWGVVVSIWQAFKRQDLQAKADQEAA